MKHVWAVVFTLILMLLASGCRHHDSMGAKVFVVESVYRATHCLSNSIEAHALWVDSLAELQRLWENRYRSRLGGSPLAIPEVDFNTQGLLWIHMGQQSTGGYALALADPICRVKNEIASVSVNWISPASDAMVTQVITSPCILLKLPKGPFHSIQVIDQDGRVRLSEKLN